MAIPLARRHCWSRSLRAPASPSRSGSARLLREGKTPDAANAWIQRAQAVYRERLKTFPEAGVGHAVDHFLQFGTPAEALDLARRNARLRPFGDAQITLAAALYPSAPARPAKPPCWLAGCRKWMGHGPSARRRGTDLCRPGSTGRGRRTTGSGAGHEPARDAVVPGVDAGAT